MGKRLIQQRRGAGTPTYRAASHKYKAKVKFHNPDKPVVGIVLNLIHCPAHSAPLARIKYEDGYETHIVAPEKIFIGQRVSIDKEVGVGNIMKLQDIPEGTSVFSIERRPGDGGKFVRGSGTFAKVVGKNEDGVIIKLPSKREKLFKPQCRACIGVVAGGERTEKPLVKAGNKHHKMRAKNKLYPRSLGVCMNAVDHPYGGKSSHHKGKPTIAPKNAPPGRKVGKIRPRRVGRKKK